MKVDTTTVWTSVCGDLEVAMSGPTFGYWIKPCFIKSVTEMDAERVIVELASPSAYHVQQIDARYYGQIKQSLERQLAKRVELALIVGQRGENASPVNERATGRETRNTTREPKQLMPTEGLFDEKRSDASGKPGLFPKYTFDSFVVGSSNNLAYAAAKAVVSYPGVRHNPLFIWGGVGVGKTHLMQAVGHALANKGIAKVTYINSETFTNDLVASLRAKNVDAFKKKYREVGALLIDDVQFFSGKEMSQEELFNTFNVLYQNGVQIVLTSDRKPQEIDKMEQRLVSRFLGGLTVDIGMPDYEMRVAILSKKAAEMSLSVSPEIINSIAANVVTNARELEGTFLRLATEATISGGVIEPAMVAKITGGKQERENKRIRPIQLISLVAKHFDFRSRDLLGKSRKADLVLARHIAIFLLRDDLGLQLTKVGELMGGRDHTTIMHAADKIKQECKTDQEMRGRVMKLRAEMYL